MSEKLDHTKMGKDNCPTCNYELDCATKATGEHETPMPHDVSICSNCGEHLEYADDMALILLTDKTKSELSDRDLFVMNKATNFIKSRGLIKRNNG